MAAESLVSGLLAFLIVVADMWIIHKAVFRYVRFDKADKVHFQPRRLFFGGFGETKPAGAEVTDDLSPEGLHEVHSGWYGARERFGRKARKGKEVAFFLSLAVLLAVPGTALADDGGNVWGPQVLGWDDGNVVGVMTVADNKYNAALFALGYDPNDSDTFNEVVKAKLSNESTGSSFYTFAQLFETGQPLWFPNYENVSGVYFTVVTLYGADRVYSARYETVHALQARVALEAILSGGGSGGGSSLVPDYNGYVLIPVEIWGPQDEVDISYVGIKQAVYQDIYNHAEQNGYSVFTRVKITGGAKIMVMSAPQSGVELTEHDNVWNRPYVVRWLERFTSRYFESTSVFYDTYNGQNCIFTNATSIRSINFSPNTDGTWPINYYAWDGGSEVVPPSNWPVPVDPHIWDEPPVPDPPEPTSPIIIDDPIFLPDPTMPIPTPEDGPTYTTVDLSAVIDAMNRHCIHLQNAIYGAASQFWGLLSSKMTSDLSAFTSWLGDWLEVIADNITDGILHLEDYLHSLGEWLAEQFDYSVTSSEYNDGSVVAWLKKIWAKLGTGSVVSRPDDPVADPIGIGDWLGSFFAGLLNDLKGLIDSILGEFGTDLESLVTKFPFSIPWDVAVVLGALVAPPQVPHIEYPMYTVGMGGLEYVTDVVIDLSDWSDIMAVVRNFELLTFGGFLAMKTKHFMELMEGVDV